MALSDPLARTDSLPTIKYQGIFDIDSLFKMGRKWFIDNGYEFHEAKFIRRELAHEGHREDVDWRCTKKITEYIKFEMFIQHVVLAIKPVEVIREGKKMKLSKASVNIQLEGKFLIDYQGRFEKSPWLEALRSWFNKYILYKDLYFVRWDELYDAMYELHGLYKNYLGMNK